MNRRRRNRSNHDNSDEIVNDQNNCVPDDAISEAAISEASFCYCNVNRKRIFYICCTFLLGYLVLFSGVSYIGYMIYFAPNWLPQHKQPPERADFALEPSGAKIVSFEGKPLCQPKGYFGITFCEDDVHGPSAMIQATISPGHCWAFQGSQAKALIDLVGVVCIDAVTLEHISPKVSPSGKIDSAPKDFKISGFDDGKNKYILGAFTYDHEGESIQTFPVASVGCFDQIEFEVQSNHGNQEYTCVYRLRVHGSLKKP